MSLQPRKLFFDELTRLNELYWTSSYCFRRTSAILRALASVGHHDRNPRVDEVWPSTNDRELAQISVPSDDFERRLERLLTNHRTASILHACSAFENCLSNYFSLCLLYSPNAVNDLKKYESVPNILKSPLKFAELKSKIKGKTEGILKGSYSLRATEFSNRFNTGVVDNLLLVRLDQHYDARNTIAHDQGLSLTDDPTLSAEEILSSRLAISEADWKIMLSDFKDAIDNIDNQTSRLVVTDGGLWVAIYRILERQTPITIGEAVSQLQSEWRININGKNLRPYILELNHKIRQGKRKGLDEIYKPLK